MNNCITLDVETTQDGDVVLIGIVNNGKYSYFTENKNFWKYIKKNKIKEVWAHNVEFDFLKVVENTDIKYCCHFNTSRLIYIQAGGNVFFKDLYCHVAYTLKIIGDLIDLPKLTIDYETIKEVTPELLEYNKRDCMIVYKAVNILGKIYKKEGVSRVKSTVGSQALKIFLKRYNTFSLKRLKGEDIDIWRYGYKGGIVEAYQKGYFNDNTFYKIDVNSMYPKIMSQGLPYPYKFKKTKILSNKQRQNCFWLGVTEDMTWHETVINSIEHRDLSADYYYVFLKKCYPFKEYVEHFYNMKSKETDFKKEVYKKLLNALYGKFGQRNETELVTNFNYKKSKNIISRVPYVGDLFQIRVKDNYQKFWVNLIWALFITAGARQYMMNLKKHLIINNFQVYYIDTDAFIISGDIEKIKNLINKDKLGLFKIEDMSNSIDIRGKKMYRFGEVSRCVEDCKKCKLKDCIYKCKGVPRIYRKRFFSDGYVQFKKMVRFKEAYIQDRKMGAMVMSKKTDKLKKENECLMF